DYYNTVAQNNNTAYILFDQVSSVRTNDTRYGLLTKQVLDAKIAANTAPTKSIATTNTYSAYVSDVLDITNRLNAMASLRIDYFETKGTLNVMTGKYSGANPGQLALSPKFGVVYQLVKSKVSVFGNYMNGFRNVAPVTQPLSDISGTFKPQQANQLEGGIKLDLFNHNLTLTASYYDLLVKDITRSQQYIRGTDTVNITVQDATQASRGFEFDVAASPVAGLNFIAGYSYNDSKLVKADATTQGRRPTSAGPQNLANVWLSYTFLKGSVKGLGVGIGGNYASENMITSSSLTGYFSLPSYAVLNASVFYNANSYRIALKADNLTDEVYYGGWTTIERNMPRRFALSLAFKF
ncbi:MAG: TonB-dependent receptor, partial [Sphingobacteriales bacterium]|nr:TonB-dependent receptor [Sphingobacteriales bacterium]